MPESKINRLLNWIEEHPTMRLYVPVMITLVFIAQIIQSVTQGGCPCG